MNEMNECSFEILGLKARMNGVAYNYWNQIWSNRTVETVKWSKRNNIESVLFYSNSNLSTIVDHQIILLGLVYSGYRNGKMTAFLTNLDFRQLIATKVCSVNILHSTELPPFGHNHLARSWQHRCMWWVCSETHCLTFWWFQRTEMTVQDSSLFEIKLNFE